jgi:serine/threonine protein kinase
MLVTCPSADCGHRFHLPEHYLGRHVEAPCGHRFFVGVEPTLPFDGPPAVLPQPGSVLGGRYHLLREQARGGGGVVFQAHDRHRDRPVAVKLLRTDRRHDPRLRDQLRAEAEAAGRVSHRNVVAVSDFADPDDGSPFLVMEWLDGGSVADLLRSHGVLPPQVATRAGLAACRALLAVHRAGLIHRDVKPDNLLLWRGGLKLGDFGLAIDATSDEATDPEGTYGTPGYFAPEQAWAEPLDPRCDLYSLGATYFELLTGRKPFHAHHVGEYARLHRDAPVPDPRATDRTIPTTCAAIVRRAMAKDRAHRYSDAAEMLADLTACLARLDVAFRAGR